MANQYLHKIGNAIRDTYHSGKNDLTRIVAGVTTGIYLLGSVGCGVSPYLRASADGDNRSVAGGLTVPLGKSNSNIKEENLNDPYLQKDVFTPNPYLPDSYNARLSIENIPDQLNKGDSFRPTGKIRITPGLEENVPLEEIFEYGKNDGFGNMDKPVYKISKGEKVVLNDSGNYIIKYIVKTDVNKDGRPDYFALAHYFNVKPKEEKKGWFGRNWPYVIGGIIAIGVGAATHGGGGGGGGGSKEKKPVIPDVTDPEDPGQGASGTIPAVTNPDDPGQGENPGQGSSGTIPDVTQPTL